MVASEFQAFLLEFYIQEHTKHGNIYIYKKLSGEDDQSYITAVLYDSDLGASMISALTNSDYCHIFLLSPF